LSTQINIFSVYISKTFTIIAQLSCPDYEIQFSVDLKSLYSFGLILDVDGESEEDEKKKSGALCVLRVFYSPCWALNQKRCNASLSKKLAPRVFAPFE